MAQAETTGATHRKHFYLCNTFIGELWAGCRRRVTQSQKSVYSILVLKCSSHSITALLPLGILILVFSSSIAIKHTDAHTHGLQWSSVVHPCWGLVTPHRLPLRLNITPAGCQFIVDVDVGAPTGCERVQTCAWFLKLLVVLNRLFPVTCLLILLIFSLSFVTSTLKASLFLFIKLEDSFLFAFLLSPSNISTIGTDKERDRRYDSRWPISRSDQRKCLYTVVCSIWGWCVCPKEVVF